MTTFITFAPCFACKESLDFLVITSDNGQGRWRAWVLKFSKCLLYSMSSKFLLSLSIYSFMLSVSHILMKGIPQQFSFIFLSSSHTLKHRKKKKKRYVWSHHGPFKIIFSHQQNYGLIPKQCCRPQTPHTGHLLYQHLSTPVLTNFCSYLINWFWMLVNLLKPNYRLLALAQYCWLTQLSSMS